MNFQVFSRIGHSYVQPFIKVSSDKAFIQERDTRYRYSIGNELQPCDQGYRQRNFQWGATKKTKK